MYEIDDQRFRGLLKNQHLIDAYHRDWAPMVATSVCKTDVESRFQQLYLLAGSPEPVVIWCESPWQLAVAPFLLDVMLRFGWQAELGKSLVEPLWSRCYEDLSLQLTDRVRQRLRKCGVGKPLGRNESLWQRLLLRLDQSLRTSMGHQSLDLTVYATLRNSIFPPGPRERMATTLLGPRLLAQIVPFLSRSTRARRRLMFDGSKFVMPEDLGIELADRDVRLEHGTFEGELVDQLGSQSTKLLAKELGCVDNPNISDQLTPETAFGKYVSGEISAAISSIAWRIPDDSWLRVYGFPYKFIEDEPLRSSPCLNMIDHWRSLMQYDIMFILYGALCLVCPAPPSVSFDSENRLHAESAPAVAFPDGFEIYSWHDVTVPRAVILHPEKISVKSIDKESNVEVRRVMLERYGFERYLIDSGATEIHRDQFGVLYSKPMPGDEPLVMVCVKNSTPEPDGSYKNYFLRVPPSIVTARAAVAWTFNMDWDEYLPKKQT